MRRIFHDDRGKGRTATVPPFCPWGFIWRLNISDGCHCWRFSSSEETFFCHWKKSDQQFFVPLLCSHEQPGWNTSSIQLLAQEGCGPAGVSAEEATEMIRWIENLSCEERLRHLGLFILETLWQHSSIWSGLKRAGEGLFIGSCSGRGRGDWS